MSVTLSVNEEYPEYPKIRPLPDRPSSRSAVETLANITFVTLALGAFNLSHSGPTPPSTAGVAWVCAATICAMAKMGIANEATTEGGAASNSMKKVNRLVIYLLFLASIHCLTPEMVGSRSSIALGVALCAVVHGLDLTRPDLAELRGRVLEIGVEWLDHVEDYDQLDAEQKERHKQLCMDSPHAGDRQFYHIILKDWRDYSAGMNKVNNKMAELGVIAQRRQERTNAPMGGVIASMGMMQMGERQRHWSDL